MYGVLRASRDVIMKFLDMKEINTVQRFQLPKFRLLFVALERKLKTI